MEGWQRRLHKDRRRHERQRMEEQAQGHEDGPVERGACRCWPMKSEEKRKDLAGHRQCDTEAASGGRARKSGVKRSDEDLPLVKKRRACRGLLAASWPRLRLVFHGLRQRLPLDLSEELCGEVAQCMMKVEQGESWLRLAPRCSNSHCLAPNDDPMVGMAEGADCTRVEAERSDSVGCHGDAQQTSRENGLGGVVGGGGGFEHDVATAFERGRLMAVWKWAMHFRSPWKILRLFLMVFRASQTGAVRRVCCKPAANDHSHLVWFQMLGPASKDCFFLLDSPDG